MLHGSPSVYTYSHCHQMITQQRPKGPWRLWVVTTNWRFFQRVRHLISTMPVSQCQDMLRSEQCMEHRTGEAGNLGGRNGW